MEVGGIPVDEAACASTGGVLRGEGEAGASASGDVEGEGELPRSGGVEGEFETTGAGAGEDDEGVAGTPMIGPVSPSFLANGAKPQLLQVHPWESLTICPCLHFGQVTVGPVTPDKARAVATLPVKTRRWGVRPPEGPSRSYSVISPTPW